MAIVTPDLAAIWRGIQVCLLPNLQECLEVDVLTALSYAVGHGIRNDLLSALRQG